MVRRTVFTPSPEILKGICFRLRMISVASSTTPGMGENSCSTPSIRTAVIAAPSMELSSTRRRLLPMVVPKPRWKGCAVNMPYRSVRVSVLATNRFGFWKPLNIKPRLLWTGVSRLSDPLLRVKLDDELLVQLNLYQLAALRKRGDAALEPFAIHVDPIRSRSVGRGVARGQDGGVVLAGFADGDDIAELHLRRRDVALAAVELDVAVAHNLARLCAAGAEAHAIDDAVHAAFEARHEVFAGDALAGRGLLIGAAELPFEDAVNAPHLLFFAKLQPVADNLRFAIFTVL